MDDLMMSSTTSHSIIEDSLCEALMDCNVLNTQASFFTENESTLSSITPSVDDDGEKARKSVRFSTVTEFTFTRDVGYCSIPGSGLASLGMNATHFDCRTLTVIDHCRERVRRRRKIFYSSSNAHRSRHRSLHSLCSKSQTMKFPTKLSKEYRNYLLRMSGVRKPPLEYTRDLNTIRRSRRSKCGCNCRGGVCLPDKCQCALAGISCQSDKPNWPCSCNASSCFNPFGCAQFSSSNVRRHMLSTLCRLRIETALSSVQWEERDLRKNYPLLRAPIRFRCAETIELCITSPVPDTNKCENGNSDTTKCNINCNSELNQSLVPYKKECSLQNRPSIDHPMNNSSIVTSSFRSNHNSGFKECDVTFSIF